MDNGLDPLLHDLHLTATFLLFDPVSLPRGLPVSGPIPPTGNHMDPPSPLSRIRRQRSPGAYVSCRGYACQAGGQSRRNRRGVASRGKSEVAIGLPERRDEAIGREPPQERLARPGRQPEAEPRVLSTLMRHSLRTGKRWSCCWPCRQRRQAARAQSALQSA